MVLGNNPVSSDPESVAAIQSTLKDLLVTFDLDDVLPHCVLSHVDVQAEVERRQPGSTALWFQSIAGVDDANRTFDIDTQKMNSPCRFQDGSVRLLLRDRPGRRISPTGTATASTWSCMSPGSTGSARALSHRVAQAGSAPGHGPGPCGFT